MNYLTNDTELTAVADAIREKCDTSDSLEWPNGFIQAIEDCQTGGPELEWLWGNQITNTMSGTIDSTDDAYAGPILSLDVDGVSTQVTTTGKNLFDKDNAIILNGYLTVNASEGWAYLVSNASNRTVVIPVEPNTTYTFSLTTVKVSTAGDDIPIALYDNYPTFDSENKGQFIPWNQWTWTAGPHGVVTFTTGANTEYVACKYANTSKVNPVSTIATIQLEVGSTATAYEPYSGGSASPRPDWPQDILSVDELTLALCGLNQFDVDNVIFANGHYYDQRYNGAYFSSTYARMVTTYIPVFGEATYTLSYSKDDTYEISCGVMFYNKDKVFVTGTTFAITAPVGEKSVTFTTPSDARYLRFHLSLNSSNIQLELGSTATAYEPYQGTIIPLYDGTLRSLPDGTKDELHLAYLKPSTREGWAWYSRELVERTVERQITSFTRIYTDTDTRQGLIATPRFYKAGLAYTGKVISNRFTYFYAAYNYGGPGTFNGDDTYVFESSTFVDLAAANAWLAENPVTVINIRDNPVTTTLDPIELPIMPSENATIWCDGGSAQPTFMLEYIQDANIVISRLEDSIADLATS